MNSWDGWTAEDWTRHYAAGSRPAEQATGQSLLDQATQAARSLAERGQQGLQQGWQRAGTQLHSVLDAPGRVVSAVELEAERLRKMVDDEAAKFDKTVKVVALGALGLIGLMVVMESKKT